MKRPEEVKLSQEEGEALIERVQANRLTEADQRVVVQLIRLYFWLTFALRETKISLGRLKTALFGKGSKKPRAKDDDDDRGGPEGGAGEGDGGATDERASNRDQGGDNRQRRQGHAGDLRGVSEKRRVDGGDQPAGRDRQW